MRVKKKNKDRSAKPRDEPSPALTFEIAAARGKALSLSRRAGVWAVLEG
jgi:hypothetical protein